MRRIAGLCFFALLPSGKECKLVASWGERDGGQVS
jgi:hypothetical protein